MEFATVTGSILLVYGIMTTIAMYIIADRMDNND